MRGEIDLWLRLFGPPGVSVGGGLLRFPSRKGLALLMLLAVDGPQPRERLAAWLWPDSPVPRDALRNALAQVNKVLAAANVVPLEADRQLVSWPASVRVDALELDRESRLHRLEDVVRGLGGVWLDGFTLDDAPEFEGWALERGAFFTGVLQQKLEGLIDRALQANRPEAALTLAQQRLRLDALNESAYQQLMRTQRSAGREAEARETLLLCQTTLQRELGVGPSAKTLGVLLEPLMAVQSSDAPIGRDAELAWLERLRTRHGLGLLIGEAGSGKTAVMKAAWPEAVVLECRPNDAALPFSSVLRGVRRRLRAEAGLADALPDWARSELSRFMPELHAEALPDNLERVRLYAAFSLLFPQALTLLVDDVQFMDEASAAWLWQVVQHRLDEGQAATVLAFRPGELNVDSQTAITQLERFAEVQRLEPLSASDLAAWLPRFGLPAHLAEEFWRLTGGNALFFKEAAGAYAATGHFERGLLPLLQRRLQALSGPEWQLAQFVAVASTEASLALATQVLRLDQLQVAQTWARLEALDVLRGSRFTHDLLRDAALGLTPATVRHALSAAMLEVFEARLRQGEVLPMPLLAEAAANASDARREAHYRVWAALETYQLGLIRAGITHLERALELLGGQPMLVSHADLETLYFKLTPLFTADVYSTPNLSRMLEQLLALARARGVAHLEAFALALQADVLALAQHRTDQARALFAQALELVGSNQPTRFVIHERLAWCENAADNTRLALEHANRALEVARALQDASLEFRALEAVYMFEQNLGLWTEAKTHALQAANVALGGQYARIGRPYALTMVAHCALHLGELDLAERHARTALALQSDSEWHNGLGFAKRTLAAILLERDELSQALELARESVGHNETINNDLAVCSSLCLVARVHLAAHRDTEALTTLDQAEQSLSRVAHFAVANLAQSVMDSLRCAAKTRLGLPALHDALRAIHSRTDPPQTIGAWLMTAREHELTAIWPEHPELAQTELTAFVRLHPDNPRAPLLHGRAEAAVLALQGQPRQASARLEHVHSGHEQQPARRASRVPARSTP